MKNKKKPASKDPDLFSLPAARRTDPETSHMAAKGAALGASKGRMAVLRCLLIRAMTDYELAAATSLQQNSIGKRRGECRDHGLVEEARDGRGETVKRESPTKSLILVWQITEKGRQFYAEHGGIAPINSVAQARQCAAID